MIQHQIDIRFTLPMGRERAMKLVSVTDAFASAIFFKGRNLSINGKSMLGLMALRQNEGEPLLLECDGYDEKEAMEQVLSTLKSYRNVDKL